MTWVSQVLLMLNGCLWLLMSHPPPQIMQTWSTIQLITRLSPLICLGFKYPLNWAWWLYFASKFLDRAHPKLGVSPQNYASSYMHLQWGLVRQRWVSFTTLSYCWCSASNCSRRFKVSVRADHEVASVCGLYWSRYKNPQEAMNKLSASDIPVSRHWELRVKFLLLGMVWETYSTNWLQSDSHIVMG